MRKYGILLAGFLILGACSSTKYVPEGRYLLTKAKINVDDKRIVKSEAASYLKQKPNYKVFWGVPLNLWAYDFSGADTTKWINRFFRKLGKAPVLYDSVKTQRTTIQLERFMRNKGFYDARVKTEIKFKKKKAEVVYNITANKPKIIESVSLYKDSLSYKVIGRENMAMELEDSSVLRQMLLDERKKSVIQVNDLLDVDKLKEERERLEKLYDSKGYYNFVKENIHFYLDTTKQNNKVSIYYGLRKGADSLRLRKYQIGNVFVRLGLANSGAKLRIDSLEYEGIKFYYKGSLKYKPAVLKKAIVLKKGQIYNPQNVEETKFRLGVLQQFRYANVSFVEQENTDSLGVLDCFVQLVPQKRQSFGVEATLTVNSGDFGGAGKLSYRHKNLFRGAELFTAELSAGAERVNALQEGGKYIAKEIGGKINLVTPKFFLPFLKAKKWRTKVPRTSFSVLYNYANRPEYLRKITDITFSYQWKSKEAFTHIFTPIDLGFLKVDADENFLKNLNSYYRQTSYVDHIIPATRYSLRFNNRGQRKWKSYQRARFNVEVAGNLLNTIDRITDWGEQQTDAAGEKYHSYFGIRYAQFVRSDIEFSQNQVIRPGQTLVFHTFLGVGYPYGNSTAMPFEKLYFLGGSNSMRAWQPRSLGPGSSRLYKPNEGLSYGEMKLEGNIEYRFALSPNWEGAFFVDAGNVWNISNNSDRDPSGKFNWNNFYKQIAVGSGLGLRYNISNIILRFDAAVKIIDPYLEGNTFVFRKEGYQWRDITLNFGIGYPF